MPYTENRGTLTVLQNAVAVAGNGSALVLVSGHNMLYEVSGTYTVMQVNFEGSLDGGTAWFPLSVLVASVPSPSQDNVTNTTVAGSAGNGFYRLRDASGLTHTRARVSGSGTGTVTVRAVEGLY
jgi:hypothetical protein